MKTRDASTPHVTPLDPDEKPAAAKAAKGKLAAKAAKGKLAAKAANEPPPAAPESPRTLAEAIADARPVTGLTAEELASSAALLSTTWASVTKLNLEWIAAKKNAEVRAREMEQEVAARFFARCEAEKVHQVASERLRLIRAELEARAGA